MIQLIGGVMIEKFCICLYAAQVLELTEDDLVAIGVKKGHVKMIHKNIPRNCMCSPLSPSLNYIYIYKVDMNFTHYFAVVVIYFYFQLLE